MRLCRLCKRLLSDDQPVCPEDKSSTVETQLEPLPGELEERFPEREPLARGGTGTLYLIDRPGSIENQLGPQLVLKVLAADLSEDPTERARHRRDLRKQQGLIHPQLPAVLEEGEADGRIWFTREYLPGTSLAVRLHQSGAFALDDAIHLILQLAAALDGLHQLGLVHRDLKPGHVLLRSAQPDSRGGVGLQLIDATLASPLMAGGSARGTPDYAAKEIIDGAASTARSDLYALGCLGYELIKGVPPFRGARDDAADVQATLDAQRNLEPKPLPELVPHAVRSAIASMLAKDARRRPFSAQQVRRSIEPVLAPVKPAARSGSLSALQREAAALRLTGPTAKHPAPTKYSDATVELDVKDLDEAIQASEEQDQLEEQATRAAPKKGAAVEDSAPTIALQSSTLQPAAVARSQVTQTHAADKSATVASAGGTRSESPVGAQGADPALARKPARAARGDATTRTHVPSDSAPPSPAAPLDAAFETSTSPTNGTSPAAEAPRRTRTGTMFGVPAVGLPSAPAADAETNASESRAAAAREGTTSSAAEAPRRTRTGTKFGIPAVVLHADEPTASPVSAASEPNASDVTATGEIAAPATEEAPRRARTGTKFGLGPVSKADVEAAALAAQLQHEHGAGAQPQAAAALPPVREHGLQPPAAARAKPSARRTRYSTSPKPFLESPRLLLWAAGGLAAFVILLRLVLGPAERSRSASIVVHVPEATTETAAADPFAAELSEQSLIGGDVKRAPLVATVPAQRRGPLQPLAAASAPAPEPERDDPLLASEKRVPTVSAVSVRGGLARAASNRPAAVSGIPAPADYKTQARELYKAGKYREAADAYERATKQNATDAAAFAGLGGSLLATGDVRKAIAAYQKAVRLEPEVSGFQAALGRAYLKKGDRIRARAAYSKALELDPNNQAARTGMASAKAR